MLACSLPHLGGMNAVSQPQEAGTGLGDRQRAALFAGPVKLGWVFRDRRLLAAPFAEAPPRPVPESVDSQMRVELAAAEQYWRKTRRESIRYGAIFLIGLLLARTLLGGEHVYLIVLLILAVLVAFRLARSGLRRKMAAAAISRASRRHERALTAWEGRKRSHDRAEAERVADFHEWGPVLLPPHVRRLDVFGGSLWGWEALLTVYGASQLAVRPLLVADLTGELVCNELLGTAADRGLSCSLHELPAELGTTGLLSSFTPGQLATVLSEVMCRTGNDSQGNRALDVRILEQAAAALGGRVSFTRLTAAIRIVLGHPATAGVLEPAERAAITELFPADYRQHVHPSLIRIESLIAPLAATETSTAEGPVPDEPERLCCLVAEPATGGVRGELLASLLVQWLTIRVSSVDPVPPAVIIAGADEIPRAHLERLSDACERRAVPLTLLFRHLRETAAELAGGGGAAFMRLGNDREAATAADLIGRQHKFVLSQLTASLGGNQTHTRADTEGTATTTTRSGGGHVGLHLPIGGGNPAVNFGPNWSRSRARTRNWSSTMSWAHQSNWSDAETKQRVYEYAVEPNVIQNLPDHALLLLTTGAHRLVVTPVECDPAIIMLPRVSADPLPPLPVRRPPAGPAGSLAHPNAGNGLCRPPRPPANNDPASNSH